MAAKKEAEENEKKLFSEKDRGTSDDMEVLLLILKEHPNIRRKVEEKVKQAKARIKAAEKREKNKNSNARTM